MFHDTPYLQLIRDILNTGERKADRTGTGTLSTFGTHLSFDVSEYFPLLTTKKIYNHGVLHELLWFISGDTNIKYLQDNKVNIWNEWADEKGDLGPVYGKQWRRWETNDSQSVRLPVDQLRTAIDTIKTNPDSRRIIVNSWNVAELDDMALPPCHLMYQFYVCNGNLSLQWYQRSVDVFLGLPFNIASYAYLLYMVAHITGLKPHKLHFAGGDTHLYLNHVDQAKEQLRRSMYQCPKVSISRSVTNIDDFKFEDFKFDTEYKFHPTIKAAISK